MRVFNVSKYSRVTGLPYEQHKVLKQNLKNETS